MKKLFNSEEGKEILAKAEKLIQEVYNGKVAKRAELEVRDKVITKIRDAFTNCSQRNYYAMLTGKLTIAGFGSC